MSKKTTVKKQPKQKPWKKHKQSLISLQCGVRVEVDKGIASLIRFMNYSGLETRHSCQGKKPYGRGYVSMFATPRALGLAHYLIEHGSESRLVIERDIHPNGYDNVTFRWPMKKQQKFEDLVHKYFS